MSRYMCEKCQDTGYIVTRENGMEMAERCECLKKRIAADAMERSGISPELQKKGFNNFNSKGIDTLEMAKKKALEYYNCFRTIEHSRNNSIIFCGQVGSGKTHLAMAICNNLINVCGIGITYMAYRNAVTLIKQSLTDKDDYGNAIRKFCMARVLCIDDLLKGKITQSDLNILYEIINYRYMNNSPMVLSTEMLPDDLIEFDEAVGSRILEMCRGNVVVLEGKKLNYRLYSK